MAIHEVGGRLRVIGVLVNAVEADLATTEGVDRLYEAARGRPIDVLMANAGHGLGGGFLAQDFSESRHVVDTTLPAPSPWFRRWGAICGSGGKGAF